MNETLRIITQEEFDNFEINGFTGNKMCPTGDYSEVNGSGSCKFEDNCKFGRVFTIFDKWCYFGNNCVFNDYSVFERHCRFGNNCTFAQNSLFRGDSRFGDNCVFGKNCWFADDVKFGKGCKVEDDFEFNYYQKFTQYKSRIEVYAFYNSKTEEVLIRSGMFVGTLNEFKEKISCMNEDKELYNCYTYEYEIVLNSIENTLKTIIEHKQEETE